MHEKTIKSRIFNVLTEEILDGTLPVGSTYPTEAELCNRFGASRTTIRAALQMLRSNALLDSFQGSGNYVIGLAPGEFGRFAGNFSNLRMTDWFGLRLAIEVEASRLAARNRTTAQVGRLKQIIADQGAVQFEGHRSIIEFRRLDIAFHEILFEASGNPVFPLMSKFLSPMVMSPIPFDNKLISFYPVQAAVMVQQHQDILAAVDAGNESTAEETMRVHISTILSAITNALKMGLGQRNRADPPA
ncbi:MAG: FCD domain-containing protein [Rhizobiaceae bacterium]